MKNGLLFFILLVGFFQAFGSPLRDYDAVMLKMRGGQALPQVCPIMVVAKIESIEGLPATNGKPPLIRGRVIEGIWGHLKKNSKFKAQWLPLESRSEFDDNFESWSKKALKVPEIITQKEIVLGLFPSEKKKEYEFVVKPFCRYISTNEARQQLECLHKKSCHEFLPVSLVIR
jgi:hypothetical protein